MISHYFFLDAVIVVMSAYGARGVHNILELKEGTLLLAISIDHGDRDLKIIETTKQDQMLIQNPKS